MATVLVKLANKAYKIDMSVAKEIRSILKEHGELLPEQMSVEELAAGLTSLTKKECETLMLFLQHQ